jgi:hypothetical protein
MSKVVDPSKGVLTADEVLPVLTGLLKQGSPAAAHLAHVLGSIPGGAAVSGEARKALIQAVFDWQVSIL